MKKSICLFFVAVLKKNIKFKLNVSMVHQQTVNYKTRGSNPCVRKTVMDLQHLRVRWQDLNPPLTSTTPVCPGIKSLKFKDSKFRQSHQNIFDFLKWKRSLLEKYFTFANILTIWLTGYNVILKFGDHGILQLHDYDVFKAI